MLVVSVLMNTLSSNLIRDGKFGGLKIAHKRVNVTDCSFTSGNRLAVLPLGQRISSITKLEKITGKHVVVMCTRVVPKIIG